LGPPHGKPVAASRWLGSPTFDRWVAAIRSGHPCDRRRRPVALGSIRQG